MYLRLLILLWFISACAYANPGPITPDKIPPALQDWVPWALYEHEEWRCPFFSNAQQRQCIWPAQLQLRVGEQGGDFTQVWQVYADSRIELPGDQRHWPLDVKIDGQAAIVTDFEGTPTTYVKAGRYQLSGRFNWDKLPEFVHIPAASGLLKLVVKGIDTPIPRLDEQGRVWLKQDGASDDNTAAEENRLDLRVYRHVLDDIPLQLTTRIELDVAGKAREVVLGPVFDSSQWTPMALDNPIPTRLEADGRLRIQVRPGTWVLNLSARHHGPSEQLQRPYADLGWPDEEIWVFEARNALRVVDISGVMALDPQQTGLPSAWRKFPAYRVLGGEAFSLNQTRRGDAEPAPNQLSLARELWLDFNGHGYTVQDRISGEMNSGWRLEMPGPGRLGRVNIDGQDQFITRIGDDNEAATGVEIRHGKLILEADSRIEQTQQDLSVLGWAHDFKSVEATLHLPPGWRLLHVAGVDGANTTWLRQWNLFNIFIVLITALAIAKLWSRGWGIVALLTLVLIYHEADAPRWVFLNLIAAMALAQVLPADRWFTRLAKIYRNATLLALLVIALPFIVDQARQSLYPQLEHPWLDVAQNYQAKQAGIGYAQEAMAPSPEFAVDMAQEEAQVQFMDNMPQQLAPPPAPKWSAYARSNTKDSKAYKAKKQLQQVDPNAQIQTGPGLPRWQWNAVHLSWSGPVDQSQRMQFYLLPPVFNSLLGLLRVALVVVLVAFFLYLGWRGMTPPTATPPRQTTPAASQAAALLLLSLLCLPLLVLAGDKADSAASEASLYPPQTLLTELGERISKVDKCLPFCASTPRTHLELNGDELRVHQEIHVQNHSAVPLPGEAQHWLAQEVWINGEADNILWRNQTSGVLWLDLMPGIHHVMLVGPLPKRASVQLAFPLPPHNVSVDSQGWRVEGIHDNGTADRQLQFTRETPAEDSTAATLDMGTLPPFVQVERTLHLGLDWQVETTVRRLTPADSAVVLEIPLLPGESVTSERIRVENGKALLNMSPRQTTVSWESVFAKQEQIDLLAPDTHAWHETWQLDASPIWHVRVEGIPVVQHQNPEAHWQPQWRPWPGERVSLFLTRPAGVAGQITTIDSSTLRVEPGKRVTQSTLTLSLRSSRGGHHPLKLPAAAQLQSVRINGQAQPLRLEGRQLSIPLTPGEQTIEVVFNEDRGISTRFLTPDIDLGMPSVNAQIEVEVPRSRWLFFVGGPALGPAVLFWGVLLILLLAAFALGRAQLAPLKAWQWFLLGLVVATQAHIPAVLIIVAWFVGLQWRAKLAISELPAWQFNGLQVILLGVSITAATLLLVSLQQGLLGHPDMQILGNGSSRDVLRWYQDRVDTQLPTAWIISVPLFIYRIAMLIWALWLAFALLNWLRWGWQCFSAGAVWRAMAWRRKKSA